MKKFTTAIIVMAVLAVGGVSACSPEAETTTTTVTTTKAPAKAAAVKKTPAKPAKKLPATVRDGKFEFTVTKVKSGVKSVGDSTFGEKAQGQFVLVNVTVENIGDEPQYFSDSEQKVRDAKGREFSADSGAAIYIDNNDVLFNEVNPGNKVKGVLVFDMPKNTKAVSIELHDSSFSDGVTVPL